MAVIVHIYRKMLLHLATLTADSPALPHIATVITLLLKQDAIGEAWWRSDTCPDRSSSRHDTAVL
jgi:hypothetical protein